MTNVLYVRNIEEFMTIPDEIVLKYNLVGIVKDPIIEEILSEAKKNAPIIHIECEEFGGSKRHSTSL